MSNELKKASVGPVFIGGILIFLIFGLIVLVAFGFQHQTDTFDSNRVKVRAEKLNLLDKENHEKLSTYAWANKAKGIVQLPIVRAEELILSELKAKPVKASAVKVEDPYPVGLQQPPPAPTVPATSGTAAAAAPSTPVTTSGSASPVSTPSASPATVSPAAVVPAAQSPQATPAAAPVISATPTPATIPATPSLPVSPSPAETPVQVE